jgi:hypothetical protein
MTNEEAKKRAAYYRVRAADARAKAEAMTDFGARRTMVEVARLWDRMAATAERRDSKQVALLIASVHLATRKLAARIIDG